jgi:hypothetical protein
MPVFMRRNYIFVEPGHKCLEVSSNFTNYLELGIQGITKYYLEAKIENDEFKISGILLDKDGEVLCHLKDNFIETSKNCNKEMTPYGYRIKDKNGKLVFEIQVENDLICHLKGTIYGESGEIIAQDREGEFIILKGPAIIGKSGNAIGIKLD